MDKCDYGCGQEARYTFKNGKKCCSKTTNSCPSIKGKNSSTKKAGAYRFVGINPVFIKEKCSFCNNEYSILNIKKHEENCFLNPNNIKLCPICNEPIKHFRHNITCSCKCSNLLFRSVRNKPEKYKDYRTICFYNHIKKCIICGEDKIVSVHHYDGNNKNNNVNNLVPLCPTHHQYLHSRYKDLIIDKIEEYVNSPL